MAAIEQRGDDVLLHVRVQPKAAHARLVVSDGAIRVHVTAPPADGLANRMVCDTVARAAGVPKASVRIHRGDRSRDKVLLLENCVLETVRQNLHV